MLTSWLTITVFLAASAGPCRAAAGHGPLTVAPTCRVKGHPEASLTLNCGDGKRAGVVQYWHTPFGDLQTRSSHTELDPVFMHHDGSLVVPSSSALHSGLYYCLLQHAEGTTLWPYELHISYNDPDEYEQGNSCHTVRFRRDAETSEEQAGVSDQQFAGAVAASVLLTFVLGFSAGALSRNHVLRCLGSVMTRVRAARHCRRHPDTPDHASDISMTPEPHVYMGMVTVETPNSSTSTSPPEKPKRSFRHKREEQRESSAYMEGCDHREEEEGGNLKEMRKDHEGKTEEEEEQEEEREVIGFYLYHDGGSQTETEEKKQDTGEKREEKKVGRQEEEAGERREDGEKRRVERRGSRQLAGGHRKEEDETEEKEGGDGETERQEDIYRESQPSSTDTEDEETGSDQPEETLKDDITGGRGASPSPPRLAPRRRVIRLYQYDEDGQRYCHLPDPSPDDPGPTPRLKLRSLSLTRLNAIMAAASAGPLDRRETEGEDGEERPHFHMEI